MQIDVTILIGIVGSLCAWFGYVQNRDAKKAKNTETTAEIKVILQNLNATSNKMSRDMEKVGEKVNTLSTDFTREITRLDASVASAHKRIDGLEGGNNKCQTN